MFLQNCLLCTVYGCCILSAVKLPVCLGQAHFFHLVFITLHRGISQTAKQQNMQNGEEQPKCKRQSALKLY